MENKKVTMLMILDGFGINEKTEANGVKLADTPNLDRIFTENPNTIIHTSRKRCRSSRWTNGKFRSWTY
jgi:2,3-bisphosphoglycerate-independent phosphoglycerate mutase